MGNPPHVIDILMLSFIKPKVNIFMLTINIISSFIITFSSIINRQFNQYII